MKYNYLGYTRVNEAGWDTIVSNLLYTIDKITRPWYIPLWSVNTIHYLATGNSIVVIRSKFWNKVWEWFRSKLLREFVQISDIKEKHGTLRIYHSSTNLVNQLIESTIDYSQSTCFKCHEEITR